jgi:3D (Asp-Asp-Asp) domain-containing protein
VTVQLVNHTLMVPASGPLTVQTVLARAGVPVAPGLITRPGLQAKVLPGETIVLPRLSMNVRTEEVLERFKVKHELRYVGPYGERPKEQERLTQHGRDGRSFVTGRYFFQGKDLLGYTSRKLVSSPAEPMVYTRYEAAPEFSMKSLATFLNSDFRSNRRDPGFAIPVGNGPPSAYKKKLFVEATAYTPFDPGVNWETSMGWKLRQGIVAVDPNLIPMGTKLYVQGYGYAVAADVGGAIKGNHIDLAFFTLPSALKFGRRDVAVYVLD